MSGGSAKKYGNAGANTAFSEAVQPRSNNNNFVETLKQKYGISDNLVSNPISDNKGLSTKHEAYADDYPQPKGGYGAGKLQEEV